MILSKMSDVLNQIADFVNACLGPLGSEGFDWSQLRDIIIQLISTLILFIVIRTFLWKRVTAILEARREAIDKEMTEAKEAGLKARKLAADAQERLDNAQAEIKIMLDEAEKTANLRRDDIITQAKDDARHRLEMVEAEINLEIQNRNNEIHEQIVNIAFDAAEKIVGHEINQDKYLDLVNEIIEEAAK